MFVGTVVDFFIYLHNRHSPFQSGEYVWVHYSVDCALIYELTSRTTIRTNYSNTFPPSIKIENKRPMTTSNQFHKLHAWRARRPGIIMGKSISIPRGVGRSEQ